MAYDEKFEEGVLANANYGGENVHRGIVVGALLGARVGYNNLPSHLVSGLEASDAIAREVEDFVASVV